ncbi:ABC transporter ATP-binding protein [Solwaraspora sp. WMMA2056]|uniref:ABC transporter ATP-binding protein n=1 Tax=Solwaraspora sp. WMMA2056 TaxID=3015161 RepID=UPI00259AEB62|nr:ABC transporter ATP-binding protein [Solwaraspora sp. WMMA2056]WJK38508.1 ABC transporter ATP-binding protein [Solwaraspora sp. WMMA2056]
MSSTGTPPMIDESTTAAPVVPAPRQHGATPAVEVVDLVKRYPGQEVNAVDGLSFTVRPGEVLGLLGPNGAGKSTTVGILTTTIGASSGTARVDGVDVSRHPVVARTRFAVVPQYNNLDRSLTPRQNLLYHAAYHGVRRSERLRRAQRLLTEFGLERQADSRVDFFSGGMAQRLMIARALMHDPRVVFLDEPTNGLEPQARLLIRTRIRQLRERGVTVVLTSHEMGEVAELADRVAIVDHGRLLALDTPANLLRGLAGRTVLDLTVRPGPGDDATALLAALTGLHGVRTGEVGVAGEPAAGPGPAGAGRPALAALAADPAIAAKIAAAKADPRIAAKIAAAKSDPAIAAKIAAARGNPRLAELLGAAAAGPAAEVRLRLRLDAEVAVVLGPALAVLATRAATLTDVHIGKPGLEDLFLTVTGKEIR